MDVAALCLVHGIMDSMHFTSHLGISLSGMVQLGASVGKL